MKEVLIDPNFFAEEIVSRNMKVVYKGKDVSCRIGSMKIFLDDCSDDVVVSELISDASKSKMVVIKELFDD